MTVFGEFDFIAELLAPLSADGAFGLTDDAALLPPLPEGDAWVVAKDAMVRDVHFRGQDAPDLIARKLIRTNLSDLAAMGARPIGYLLALALDTTCDWNWLSTFRDGLAEDQRAYDISLFGGDTTSTGGALTLSLTALGAVPAGQELRRNGARPGDEVWVTGTFGDSALGLRHLTEQIDVPLATGEFLASRYWLPRPRIETGKTLRGLATSCLDVSDGLLADLGHIARHSGCGMEIEFDSIPLSDATRTAIESYPDFEALPLNGGDDYELAFTLPQGKSPPEAEDTICTCIGRVTEGEGVRVVRNGETVLVDKPGWQHF